MSRRPNACHARTTGDQVMCAACGLNWDTNDTDPPSCRPYDARTHQALATPRFEAVVQPSKPAGPPGTLPLDIASAMLASYKANGGDVWGMQAAYRLLIDRLEL